MNIKEAMKHYGVSRSTLYRWIKRGKITAHKVGRRWVIDVGGETKSEPAHIKTESVSREEYGHAKSSEGHGQTVLTSREEHGHARSESHEEHEHSSRKEHDQAGSESHENDKLAEREKSNNEDETDTSQGKSGDDAPKSDANERNPKERNIGFFGDGTPQLLVIINPKMPHMVAYVAPYYGHHKPDRWKITPEEPWDWCVATYGMSEGWDGILMDYVRPEDQGDPDDINNAPDEWIRKHIVGPYRKHILIGGKLATARKVTISGVQRAN